MLDAQEQKILQKHLARFLIDDVFNTITEEDVLTIKGTNVWSHKGKELTAGQIKALRNEAQAFSGSELWKILRAELKWLAHQNGYVKARTEGDQIAAKALEYLCDVVDSKLVNMIK